MMSGFGFGFGSPVPVAQQQQPGPFGGVGVGGGGGGGVGFGVPQQQSTSFGSTSQQQQPVPSFGATTSSSSVSGGFGNPGTPGPFGGAPPVGTPFHGNGNNLNNSPAFGSTGGNNTNWGNPTQPPTTPGGVPTMFGTSPNVAVAPFGQQPQQQQQPGGMNPTTGTMFPPPSTSNNNNNSGFGSSGFGQPTNFSSSMPFGSSPQQQPTGFGVPNSGMTFGTTSNMPFGNNNNNNNNPGVFGNSNNTNTTSIGFGTSANTMPGFGAATNNMGGFGNNNNTFGAGTNNNSNTGFGFGNNSPAAAAGGGGFGSNVPPSPFGNNVSSSTTGDVFQNNSNPFGASNNMNNLSAAPTVSFGMSSNVVTSSNTGFPSNNNNNNNINNTNANMFSTSTAASVPSSNPFGGTLATTTKTTFSPSMSPMHQHSDNEDMQDGGGGGFGSGSMSPQHSPFWPQSSSTTSDHDMNGGGSASPVPEGHMADSSMMPGTGNTGTDDGEEKLARLKAKLEEKKAKMEEKRKMMELKRKKKTTSNTNDSELSADAQPFVPASSDDKNKSSGGNSREKQSYQSFLPDDLKSSNDDDSEEATTDVTPSSVTSRGDNREDLANAVSLVGNCMYMCPDEELIRRGKESDIQLLEIPQPGTLHPADWTLRETAVKRFRRSAADYKLDVPEWVRPPDVLERVCSYLEEWVMDRDRQGPDPRLNDQVPPSLDVYQFIWDRTRMVRKDFILQNYVGTGGKCDARAVRCHERIARWHAMCEHQLSHIPDFVKMQSQQNIQELGQTMKTLNQYYDDSLNRSLTEVSDCPSTKGDKITEDIKNNAFGCRSDFVQGQTPIDYDGSPLSNDASSSAVSRRLIGKHAVNSPTHGTAEPEMRGLYILLTMNNDGGMEVLKYAARLFREAPRVYHSNPVQLALRIYKAKKEYNYVRFFSILRAETTPYLFSCIMFKHVEQMRKAAFQIMSKTYGAKRKEDGGPIYDAYPLKKLEKVLCFEDLDEARAACHHYNITVKPMKIRSQHTRIEEIIQWRHSDFKERKDPEKGFTISLPPKKMVKFIESKLNGATRLAVCRGEVSGDGAALSGPIAASSSPAISPVSDSTSPTQVQQQLPPPNNQPALFAQQQQVSEEEEAKRNLQEEKMQQQKKDEEEAEARMAAMKADLLKRQEEAKRKKEEEAKRKKEEEAKRKKEEERQKEAEERAERLRLEVLKKQQLEEERRRKEKEEEEARRKIEEERLKRERELEAQREMERQERLRREEMDLQRKEEEKRRSLEAEALEKRKAEHLRELQKREQQEAEEKQRKLAEEKERKLNEARRLEKLRLIEQERKRKEEAEEVARVLQRKVDKARKILIWRRWREMLPRKQMSIELARQSLSCIDPTFVSGSSTFRRQNFLEPLDSSGLHEIQPWPQTTTIAVNTRKILEGILSEPLPTFDLTSILQEAIEKNKHQLGFVENSNRMRKRRASIPGYDNRTSTTTKTTILLKVAIILPESACFEEDGICELVHGWLNSRLRYDEILISGETIGSHSCEIRVVFVNGWNGCIPNAVCDMALFVIPPPWSAASRWKEEATKNALSAVFSRVDKDIPLVVLVLGDEDLQQSNYCNDAKRFLMTCMSSSSSSLPESQPKNDSFDECNFPIVFPLDLSRSALDGALESSCEELVNMFLRESPPVLECISVSRLGCICICDAMWKNNDLCTSHFHHDGRGEGFHYTNFARATLNFMIAELEEVQDSLRLSMPGWPARNFEDHADNGPGRDHDGNNYHSNVVKKYFGNTGDSSDSCYHLPMTWLHQLDRENIERGIMDLHASLSGSIYAVMEKLLRHAPISLRQECEIMIRKHQFRRCLQRMLLYREESRGDHRDHQEIMIYLPKGSLQNVVNNTVQKILESIRDLLPSTVLWKNDGNNQMSIKNGEEAENEENYDPTMTSTAITTVDEVDTANFASITQPQPPPPAETSNTCSPPPGISTPDETLLSKTMDNTSNNNNVPSSAQAKADGRKARRTRKRTMIKRRLEDNSKFNGRNYTKRCRDIEESSAFTRRLEALVQGDTTYNMGIGDGSTLVDILKTVPRLNCVEGRKEQID